MATTFNSHTPADFPNGKESAIKRFLELIFENVDNYEEFQLGRLKDEIGLNNEEKKQFNELLLILRKELIKSKRVEIVRGTFLRMLPTSNNDSSTNINIENFIGGDNNGIQASKGKFNDLFNQKSDSKNTKKSILQYLFWMAGIVVAGIAIYNLVTKFLMN